MTAPDLLPCPFCGYEPDGYEGNRVSCRCGAMGPHEVAGDPESPTWSTRADLATPAAMTPEVATEQAFMAAVWAALKADVSDLGKQKRILEAFRAALRAGGDG